MIKPSQKCKSAGLTGLAELVEITGKCQNTLINWSKASPAFFDLVIIGAVTVKKAGWIRKEIK